jgi:hypothetical protein
VPILLRQLRRDLPPTAKPYRDDFHAAPPGVPAE